MALGRIGGGVLKDNLERNGSNLNFKNTSGSTAILHLDVVNSRVGINTESPAATYSLDIPTPLVSTNLISDNANVQNWTLDTNRIYQNSGDINLSGSSNVFLAGLLTDNLRVNFNTFRSLADSNINLTPNGTGTVEIYSDWNSDGNIHATGDITFGGDLVLGDDDTDSVVFNSDLNSDLLPDVNDVSELGTWSKRWSNIYVTNLNSASLDTGGLKIDTNVVQTYASDLNLILRHNVNGKKVDLEAVQLENATISTPGTLGLTTSGELIVTSTQAIKLPTGNNGERPTTTGGLRFNNYWNLFEVRSNTGYMPLGGVVAEDGLTSIIAHPTNNTLNITANSLASGSVDSTGVNLTGLQVDDINFNTNVLSTTTTDTNLLLNPNGTGKITIDTITFDGQNITWPVDTGLVFQPSGYGYDKVSGTHAMVIPFGNNSNRWPTPEIGDTRWNTDSETLETFTGSSYTQSAGTGGTLTDDEMNELALQFTIILG